MQLGIRELAAWILVALSLGLTSCGGGGGARTVLPQLVAGDSHTVAIKANGTLWAWGWSHHGELGNATASDSDTPVQVGTDGDWQSVSAGYWHTAAIKNNGTLWTWGSNQNGQLGNATHTNSHKPVQIRK